ncbi:MAG: ATP-binding protein [Bacteroidota bacterium]
MKILFPAVFLFLFLFTIQSTNADEPKAIHQQQHLDALSIYKKSADDDVAKNLNRFALGQLLNYNAAIDTMYKTEMDDTIQAFKINYDRSHLTRSNAITSLNQQIKDLTEKKETATSGFNGLLRKAGIASVIWLVIVLILVQIRSKALKRVQSKLELSKGQRLVSEQKMDAGKTLLKLSHENSSRSESLNTKAIALQKIVSESALTVENGFSKEETDKLKVQVTELVRTAGVNQKIVTTVLSLENEAGAEKVNANLNLLCDQCFELVYNGMKSSDPDLKILVSKDLEKNLPQIKLIPEAVVQLLINVLINAFQSVKARQEKKVKGYVAKVTISTRVLPRFLQVRINDNGEGMQDEIIQQVSELYFTLKTDVNASGLGMHFAKKIVSELHRGELKIESEPGNKTDVYIKFFTS